MAWTQYTRNLEDVMIRRALQAVPRGCFVDVGSYHPVRDSNTYALYEIGWRGIAIDAQANFADDWRRIRPEDVFLNSAVGKTEGAIELHQLPEWTQNSTVRSDIAERYRALNEKVESRSVPLTTLNSILEVHLKGRDIHLLSVDVEGFEADVLAGLDLVRYRPWLMILEATIPGTPTPAHATWEGTVLGAGYEFVYFDGVNRFYVAQEHAELKKHFVLPPNVWDDFVSARQVLLERELAEVTDQLNVLRRTSGGL